MALIPTKTEFVLSPRNGVMDSQAAAVPPPADTVLSVAASDLAVGESVSFPCPGLEPWTGGSLTHPLYGIQWVNRWFYDSTARRAVLFGKNASTQPVGGAWRQIAVYDENAHTWSWGYFNPDNEWGHVYESFAFDPVSWSVYTGDYDDGSVLQRWTYGEPFGLTAPVADNGANISDTGGSSGAVQATMCWHPNLFGTGDGGILTSSATSGRLRAWQASSGNPGRWDQVPNTSATITGSVPGRGSACYVRAWDEVVYSLNATVGGKTWRIPAGTAGAVAAAVEISPPPVPCGWIGSNDNRTFLIDDPTGQGGPYLFEKGGDSRYWRLSGTYTWDLIGTHPLPLPPRGNIYNWCVASLYPYGVFWIMASTVTDGGGHSNLWRPEDQA